MSIKKTFENLGGPNKTSSGRPSPSVTGDINTILGKETSFKGVLTYEGTVKIDGKVEGEIIAKDPLITANIEPAMEHTVAMVGATLGVLFVLGAGLLRRRWLRRSAPDEAGRAGSRSHCLNATL